MGATPKNLPNWPYALNVNDATAYCGLDNVSTFKRMVKENSLPNPFIFRRKALWLRPALEKSLETLHEDAESHWDDINWG